jgi:molecular chaperone DnaJ
MSSGFFQVRQTCPDCGGTGQIISNPCPDCRGEGRVRTRKNLSLKIPAGVETGSRLRLAGKGEGGARGGSAGDLYVVIHVKEHAFFKRHGDDIVVELPVPMHIAALGGTVEVPTIQGMETLKIPSGTETGTVFRLRHKGVSHVHGGRMGDQHVSVRVEVPNKLDRKQKKLLEEFGDLANDKTYPEQKQLRRIADDFYEKQSVIGKP